MEILWLAVLCVPPAFLLITLINKISQHNYRAAKVAALGLAIWTGITACYFAIIFMAGVGGGFHDGEALFILYYLINATIAYFVYRKACLNLPALTIKVFLWLIIVFTVLPTLLLGLVFLAQGDQWLYFHSKEITGRIADENTGNPVEGAVVTAGWWRPEMINSYFAPVTKSPFYLAGKYFTQTFEDDYESILVSTDKDGRFEIPARSSFKPWAYILRGSEDPIVIRIYKPGYGTIQREHGMWTHGVLTQKEDGGQHMQRTRIQRKGKYLPLRKLLTHYEILQDYQQNYRSLNSHTKQDRLKEIKLIEKASIDIPFASINAIQKILHESGFYEGAAKRYHENGELHVEAMYKNGKLEGPRKVYFENKALKEDIAYRQGKRNGPTKRYYKNGKLKEERAYSLGKKNGPMRQYFENGMLKEESTYKLNKKDGIWKQYYESGALYGEATYKNDKLNGIARKYHKNGKLKEETAYTRGFRDGMQRLYDRNGILHYETPYKLGKKDGISKEYSKGLVLNWAEYKEGKKIAPSLLDKDTKYPIPDGTVKAYDDKGKIESTGAYKDGKKDGLWKTYSKGLLTSEGTYKNGRKDGLWKMYYKGNLTKEETYKDGKKNGIWKKYYANEQLMEEKNYTLNKLDGALKRYDKDGKLTSDQTYKNGIKEGLYKRYVKGTLVQESSFKTDKPHGTSKHYQWDDGTLTRENTYKDGKLDGLVKEYYGNGNLRQESIYKGGKKNGPSKKYSGGLLSSEGIYKDDKKEGLWIIYWKGKLSSEDTYKNGKLNGLSKGYHSNGNISHKALYKDDKLEGPARIYDENGQFTHEELWGTFNRPAGSTVVTPPKTETEKRS